MSLSSIGFGSADGFLIGLKHQLDNDSVIVIGALYLYILYVIREMWFIHEKENSFYYERY